MRLGSGARRGEGRRHGPVRSTRSGSPRQQGGAETPRSGRARGRGREARGHRDRTISGQCHAALKARGRETRRPRDRLSQADVESRCARGTGQGGAETPRSRRARAGAGRHGDTETARFQLDVTLRSRHGAGRRGDTEITQGTGQGQGGTETQRPHVFNSTSRCAQGTGQGGAETPRSRRARGRGREARRHRDRTFSTRRHAALKARGREARKHRDHAGHGQGQGGTETQRPHVFNSTSRCAQGTGQGGAETPRSRRARGRGREARRHRDRTFFNSTSRYASRHGAGRHGTQRPHVFNSTSHTLRSWQRQKGPRRKDREAVERSVGKWLSQGLGWASGPPRRREAPTSELRVSESRRRITRPARTPPLTSFPLPLNRSARVPPAS